MRRIILKTNIYHHFIHSYTYFDRFKNKLLTVNSGVEMDWYLKV